MDRIFRILLDEIDTQRKMLEHWQRMEWMPDDVRSKNIYGFECQLSVLLSFAEKAYGESRQRILDYLKEKV